MNCTRFPLMPALKFRAPQTMTFSASTKPGAILFDSWEPETTSGYVGALFGVAAIGIAHQMVVFARASHFRWAAAKRIADPGSFSVLLHQVIDAALFACVAAASYIAMLVAMSKFILCLSRWHLAERVFCFGFEIRVAGCRSQDSVS